MFANLFRRPFDLARHSAAPYAEERKRYLAYCHQQGYARTTVQGFARELLWAAHKLSAGAEFPVTPKQLEAIAEDWQDRQQAAGRALNPERTRARFIEITRAWLRFLGWWYEPVEPVPFADLRDVFMSWMANERGLATTTIARRGWFITRFLQAYGGQNRAFADVQLSDVDAFLAECGAKGWCRVSINHMAEALRAFFRYAATQRWCDPRLADAIQGPRIFAEETLPSGPSWSEVGALLVSLDTDKPKDIRDRAILMLFAIYGLRAGEVAVLRLDAIDWEHNLLNVARPKQRQTQPYPLIPSVGNAIVRYLRNVRPPADRREVFLTFRPPYRPLSVSRLSNLTRERLLALGVQTAHRGPHALRHACAARLVAEGLSLKEIGDHLGHHSTSATRIYAKVDLPHLREVAAFDLGELL